MMKQRRMEYLLIVVLLPIFMMACTSGNKISGTVTMSGTAMQGVTITLNNTSSAISATTTTDVNGNYIFSVYSNTSYTITASLSGYTFNPPSIAVTINNADSTGNNFTATAARRIQMGGAIQGNPLNLTATVSTLAGTAAAAGSIDGTGSAAFFNSPEGITTDGASLYVADSGNDTIRQIVLAIGAVTTLAGTAGVGGFADGIAAAARFNSPMASPRTGAAFMLRIPIIIPSGRLS